METDDVALALVEAHHHRRTTRDRLMQAEIDYEEAGDALEAAYETWAAARRPGAGGAQ